MAGLVIDSSSPAAHSAGSNTAANTTAAFTPPADALFLAAWAGDSQPGSSPAAPAGSSSPSQTWILDGWDNEQSGTPTQPGQAAFLHAVVTGTPGSSTVTVTSGEAGTGFKGSLLKLYVITGHDPVTPIGQVGGDRLLNPTSGSLSDSYTSSITGGQGFMIVCDFEARDTTDWTPAGGCTMVDKGTVTAEVSYAVLRRTNPDGVNGSATTLGMAGIAIGGGQYHWVIAEVISLEAAIAAAQTAGYPAFGANAPMF